MVTTEIVKIIPDKFDGYYELKYPDTIKVWGETSATCRWNFACYDVCEMQMKVCTYLLIYKVQIKQLKTSHTPKVLFRTHFLICLRYSKVNANS